MYPGVCVCAGGWAVGQTKGGKLARQLCSATVDFANYVATDAQAAEVAAPLEPLNKRVARGTLHLTVRCEPTAESDTYGPACTHTHIHDAADADRYTHTRHMHTR
jgi:hypothetical protein